MSTFRFGNHTLDTDKRELQRDGESVDLQPKVFDTLLYLLRNSDRVVTKDELLDGVWSGVVVTENVLARAISTVRKALGDSAQSPRFIRAVPRIGYRFVGNVDTGIGTREPAEGRKTIAILPLQPLSPDDRDEVLELGIADTLISQLSNLADLVVRPFATVREVFAELRDPLEVAERVGADACLEGSIHRRDDRVRLTVRLLSVGDQAALWSATFDEEISDIFELQDTICQRILRELTPHLTPAGDTRRRTSLSAYKAYLEGRLFLSRFSPEDVHRALSHFEAALDEDPAYAPAWAAIADCHEFIGTIGVDPGLHFAEAKRASRRALALDPKLPEALCMQAKIAWQYDWDWQHAESLFEDAIARFPNRADLHIAYSDYCCYLHLAERGVEQAQAALTIDPISAWVNTLLAQALHMSGRHHEAIKQAEWALEIAPGFPFAHFFLSLALFASGDVDRALVEIEKAVASGRPDFVAAQGYLLYMAGKTQAAQQVFDGVVAAGDQVPPIARAILFLACGEYEAAGKALEECIEHRDWHILVVNAEPTIRPAFRESGLGSLLERNGLPMT